MRHRRLDKKLGRSPEHRKALMAALVCALIEQRRIQTTLPKARCAKALAEKMVTLGRKGNLAARRQAIATLRREEHVRMLFDDVVPSCEGRNGGYTRIVKLRRRMSDGAEMVILEWVNLAPVRKVRKSEVMDKDKDKEEKKD